MDVEPLDAGVSGAKMAIDENNAGGQFTGEVYNLDVSTVTSPDKAVEALQKLYDSGHHFIIVDGSAETLLKLSDFAKGKDILLETRPSECPAWPQIGGGKIQLRISQKEIAHLTR